MVASPEMQVAALLTAAAPLEVCVWWALLEESCEFDECFPGRRFVQRAAMELAARLDQEVEVTLQLESPLLEKMAEYEARFSAQSNFDF